MFPLHASAPVCASFARPPLSSEDVALQEGPVTLLLLWAPDIKDFDLLALIRETCFPACAQVCTLGPDPVDVPRSQKPSNWKVAITRHTTITAG